MLERRQTIRTAQNNRSTRDSPGKAVAKSSVSNELIPASDRLKEAVLTALPFALRLLLSFQMNFCLIFLIESRLLIWLLSLLNVNKPDFKGDLSRERLLFMQMFREMLCSKKRKANCGERRFTIPAYCFETNSFNTTLNASSPDTGILNGFYLPYVPICYRDEQIRP